MFGVDFIAHSTSIQFTPLKISNRTPCGFEICKWVSGCGEAAYGRVASKQPLYERYAFKHFERIKMARLPF
jgi:hypothetical protein